MAPSSCLISGVFSLSEGSRNTEPSYYATYLSALDFTDDDKFINISVRKFTASADLLYADDSFVFMVAKAALPAGGDGMLDSIHCTPFKSPSEGFQPYHPPEPTHTAFITGTISGIDNTGSIRSFTLATSEYVRDEWRTFNVRFEFDGTSNRWKNVRLPAIGSTVTATGTFRDISEYGHGEPILNLLDMSYGMSETASSSPSRTVGHHKTRRTSVESPPSSSPTVRPTTAIRKISKRQLDEEADGTGETSQHPGKRSRTRRGKGAALG